MLKKGFAALRSHGLDDRGCKCLNTKDWALNSAVECHLHTVEVRGSNPLAPTISIFQRCSHLDVAATFFVFLSQPDATRWSHCVDFEVAFIFSDGSMYIRWASNALSM